MKIDDERISDVRNMLHEIGNKLHVIAGRANRLRKFLPGNETAERNLSIILDQSERAAQVLENLRRMFVPEEPLPRQDEEEI